MTVSKVDGIGTRKNDAGVHNTVNQGSRDKLVRLYASEAISKGQLVAFDFSATEPTNGYGNHVKICDASVLLNSIPIGIAAEAISSGAIGRIQVAGICTFATCSNEAAAYDGSSAALQDADEGILLTASTEAGSLRDYDTSLAHAAGGDNVPFCILIEYGTADTADSTVYLLNPANL